MLLTTRWSSCSALDSVYWGSRFNLQFTFNSDDVTDIMTDSLDPEKEADEPHLKLKLSWT